MSHHTRRLGTAAAAIFLATAVTATPIVAVVTAAPAAHAIITADGPGWTDCCSSGGG
jgi:hypothetical protein